MFQNSTQDNDWEGSTVIHTGVVLMTEPSSTPTHIVDAANTNMTNTRDEIARNNYVLLIGSCVIEPITILGLLGNSSIFWFLCCRIKRTKYTVYVLNLSIADFIVLVCHNYFFISQFVAWGRETMEAYLYEVLDILAIFGYNSSFFLLTAISVERCLGAFYPLWYHFNRSKYLSAVLCAILWVLSCAATAVEYLTTWTAQFLDEVPCRKHTAACVFLTTTWLIFIPVMVFCSVSLFIKLQRNLQPRSSARLYISIVITVVLFLILTVPARLLYLIVYWYPITQLEWTLLHFSFFLHTINTSLNPFVYFLVGRQKQKRPHQSLYGVLYASCKDEPEILPQEEHPGAMREPCRPIVPVKPVSQVHI
ncbi:proto-oncogene Mas [Pogona vitticeps]